MFENSCVLLIFQHSFFNNKISLLVHFGHFRDPPNPHLTFKNRALTVIKHQFSKITLFFKENMSSKKLSKMYQKRGQNSPFWHSKDIKKVVFGTHLISLGHPRDPWDLPGTPQASIWRENDPSKHIFPQKKHVL